MYQEPLQLVTTERWPEIQSALLSDCPRGLPGYNVLETQTRWKKQGLDYGFQVYCPFGDARNGFVAINEKDSSYDLIIQYPKDDTKVLEDALNTTKIINWEIKTKVLKLPFAAQNVISCVQKVTEDKTVYMKVTPKDMMYTYILEKDSPLFENIRLPPGFTFDLLTSDYIDLIDTKWPHHHPTSSFYFQLLIDSKSGYGLFKDGEIIAWVLIGECGNLTHLYTMEGHRKKGYAELVVKLIANVILEDKKTDVFAFCVKTNVNACKLYQKTGFKMSNDVSWPDFFHKTS